jgi:hypothetical protein
MNFNKKDNSYAAKISQVKKKVPCPSSIRKVKSTGVVRILLLRKKQTVC